MKRSIIIGLAIFAFGQILAPLPHKTVNAFAPRVQQNGVFNAQSTQPRAPQQVLFKIDLPPPGQAGNDDFFMLAIFSRADQTAQSYYGFFKKSDAMALRDQLNIALGPPVASGPPCCGTPTPAFTSTGLAIRDIPAGTVLQVQPIVGAAMTMPPVPPKRPAKVPKNAEYLGISGGQHHWKWIDKKQGVMIDTSPVDPNPNATPTAKAQKGKQ